MPEELHRDRGRAESFGSIARLYDRHRPAPAPEFLDELAALRPAKVLDVGCGTGKVARELEARGLLGPQTFIASSNWIRAGQLNALFGKDIPVLCLCEDARQFSWLNPPANYAGWTGLVIDTPRRIDETTWPFAEIGAEEEIDLMKAGRVVMPLKMLIGKRFTPAVSH